MPDRLLVTRPARIPDPLRLARFARAPELGPRILFFSGGSALNPLCRSLTRYTHNSIHLITPFDSGGSSAKLRCAFDMPAVGDLRNRLMRLSDQSVTGNPEVVRLFACRFPKEGGQEDLIVRLESMVQGKDELVSAIPDPLRKIIRNHLGYFLKAMPADFDLRGASIGNLVLTGGYLNNRRHLDPVVYLFAKLAEARGIVRPVINDNLHLCAELENGDMLVGQHLMTGREVPPLSIPIKRVFLSADKNNVEPVRPRIRKKIQDFIQNAELICYPMGSFYSSLIANLLPHGVTAAIALNECPKLFIPNTGRDVEFVGGSVARSAETLLEYLCADLGSSGPDNVLNFVLLDSKNGDYPGELDITALERIGLQVIDVELVSPRSRPHLDPELLASALLSLV